MVRFKLHIYLGRDLWRSPGGLFACARDGLASVRGTVHMDGCGKGSATVRASGEEIDARTSSEHFRPSGYISEQVSGISDAANQCRRIHCFLFNWPFVLSPHLPLFCVNSVFQRRSQRSSLFLTLCFSTFHSFTLCRQTIFYPTLFQPHF